MDKLGAQSTQNLFSGTTTLLDFQRSDGTQKIHEDERYHTEDGDRCIGRVGGGDAKPGYQSGQPAAEEASPKAEKEDRPG